MAAYEKKHTEDKLPVTQFALEVAGTPEGKRSLDSTLKTILNLGEQAFVDEAVIVHTLRSLDLRGYNISHSNLVQLCIHLSKCKHVTNLNLSGKTLGEAARHLAHSVQSWGDEPRLQKLHLKNCSITPELSKELLQCLSTCKQLTELGLGLNTLGKAGHYLAQSIKSWGDDPPLQILGLDKCSIPLEASEELLESLSTCRHLIELDLEQNNLGENGHILAKSIRSWGDDPPLKKLLMYNCFLPISASYELVQSLSTCQHIIDLNLGSNYLGQAGHDLAQSIRSWGIDPPLQKVYLYNCSLSPTALFELIQSLSVCRNLTELSLGENGIGEAGYHLGETIRSWGQNSLLQKLYLSKRSLHLDASKELMRSLVTSKYLTDLDLGENNLSEVGHNLVCTIRSWRDNSRLQRLCLHNCSLRVSVLVKLVQSLSMCRHITELDLGGNNLGEAGHDLAQSIGSWGYNSPLQQLYLYNCSLSGIALLDLVKSLGMCRYLTELSLGENDIGEVGSFLAQSIRLWNDDPPLRQLYLYKCSFSVIATLELAQSLSTCRHLTELSLSQNAMGEIGHKLAQSITSWGNNPPLQKLYLCNCNLPVDASKDLVQSLKLCRHLTELDLGENNLGEAGYFLAKTVSSWGNDTQLQVLELKDCRMPVYVWSSLFQAISSCTSLTNLDVSGNTLGKSGHLLAKLIKSWGYDPTLKKLNLANCSMSLEIWNEISQSLLLCKQLIEVQVADDFVDEIIEKKLPLQQMLLKYDKFKNPKIEVLDKRKLKKDNNEGEQVGSEHLLEKAETFDDLDLKSGYLKQNLSSLPPSLYSTVKEAMRETNVMGLKTKKKQLPFGAQISKNNKEYLVTRTFGRKVTLKDPQSEITLEISQGVRAVVMQSINMDFQLLKNVTSSNECLAAPVVQFHMEEQSNLEAKVEYKYKVTIPHYLSRHHSLSFVKVKYGNLKYPHLMTEVEKGNQQMKSLPYYQIDKRNITIYANHFCDVVCTSTQKVCTSKILAIPFGWIGTIGSEPVTHMKVKTYLCNYLYNNNGLKLKLKADAGHLGLQILEQLTVPIDYEDFEVENSEVSVTLTVTDPVSWIPTFPNDTKWDGTFKKMVERSKLPGVFNISNGHLCKSEPFDAANFALTCGAGKTSFRGNIGVTLHTPEIPDQYRNINIVLPPLVPKLVESVESNATTAGHLPVSDEKELTAAMLLKLSKKINKKIDILTLATIGLDMDEDGVDGILRDNKDEIHMAVRGVLKVWRRSQPDSKTAFINLCDALRNKDVKMESLIDETLQ